MEGLITFIAVLFVIFIAFKLFGWSIKIFFKLLINALIGAAMIFVFNYVFAGLLNLKAFYIDINWLTSLVTGIFGIPGVIVLLVIGFIA
ncbi:MAG: pro-sigmaK processing inhibitor BofA family protein [Christensenellaceae bacterium]|nr:pro-sigmaK processing inhibitor BofA family protein [Christensenellaceae bacterium]